MNKNKSKENFKYTVLQKVMNEWKSADMVSNFKQADKVYIALPNKPEFECFPNAQIGIDTYEKDGMIQNFVKNKLNLMNKIENDFIKEPCINFTAKNVVVKNIEPEYKTGILTGRGILTVYNVDYYGIAKEIKFVLTPEGHIYANKYWTTGKTLDISGTVINRKVDKPKANTLGYGTMVGEYESEWVNEYLADAGKESVDNCFTEDEIKLALENYDKKVLEMLDHKDDMFQNNDTKIDDIDEVGITVPSEDLPF
jgi:hypothetical protein